LIGLVVREAGGHDRIGSSGSTGADAATACDNSRGDGVCRAVSSSSVRTGSKSERAGRLSLAPDREYVLRRSGGNAFRDEALEALAGQIHSGEGQLTGYTFLMTKWEELAP